jgi:hypothetical protein
LSTSRHVTQGIVDVRRERWDKRRATLRGISSVVGGDPYEFRIVPGRGRFRRAVAAAVSAGDEAAGVTARLRQGKGILRVRIDAPRGRAVSWSVRFRG